MIPLDDAHSSELEEIVAMKRRALNDVLQQPQSSDARADVLHALADALHAAYDVSLSMATLEETISLYEQILRLRPAGHESRASALNNLGDSLYHFCCRHGLDQTRSDRCIEILREALQLRPPGHPLRAQSLHNLARSLRSIHYKQLGNLEILVECASLNREALELRPAGDPERLKSMNNLANDLRLIVDHTADAEILAEMVSIRREVLSMRPPGHSLRHTSLHNLGIALYSSFEQLGGSDILAEAIGTVREAMQLRPPGHSQRFSVLHNLAYALSLRFTYEGHLDSLLESICLSRKALHLLPEHHPERCEFLNNLADSLLASFRHSGDGAALMEAISLLREAMILRSPGGFAHDDTLNNLAEALEAKYDQDRSDVEVLSEAAQLHRDALQFRPTGHSRRFWSLEGLARVLCKIGFQSWPEALSCYQGALQLCPASYPGRSRLQSGMSICFLDPNSPFFSISQGISCLSEAYADSFSHVNERLKAAIIDLQRLEAAYVASTQGAQTGPPTKDDEKVLNLYSQVIGLLPLAANFGLDHNARLHALMGCDEISRNAAARAMLSTCLPQAVELLEQGRNVFWTQTLHLRMATFDGVPDADCQELKRMLRLLHHGTRRIESLEQSVSQREHELEKRRQLNEAVQILISQIRGHPGLDRFLLPPAFDALFGSLPNGFVAIVNASKLGHHALLLHRATGVVTCLALRPFRTGFDFATLRAQLPRDMSIIPEHHGEIKARAMRVDKGGVDDLEDVLSTLWASVVQPVLEALGLNKAQARARPRLWWCVTGELGFMPIHAAGIYRSGGAVCTADYVVSSYIPTLTSLAKARQRWTPIVCSDLVGLIICEASRNEGSMAYLPHAFEEVITVRNCLESAGARVLNEHAVHTSPSELQSLLKATPTHVLHMACHGVQHSDPLKSSFLLHEGRLSVEDIIQLNLPHAFLAFLSACQTAKGDQNAPDQAVHLAASMLFCGFRSVIGTMWSMCDADGPKVARHFYESLLGRDEVNLDDIAYALDEAVQVLRRSNVPASRWAPFMHIGG